MSNTVTATYYFDKESGIVSLHKHDRTCANQLAEGFGESVGMFMAILTNTIERMPNNGTISITINKEL